MQRTIVVFSLIIFLITSCVASTPSPVTTPDPSSTHTRIPNPSNTPTATVTPSTTPTSTLSVTPTEKPTPTPEGWVPQVYIGIPEEALGLDGCGDGVIFWTMNYSENYEDDSLAVSFWDYYPEIPEPQDENGNVYKYKTRAFRGNLDICAKPNFPIIFQMDEGEVLENRIEDYSKNTAVMEIKILDGPGKSWSMIWAHYNPDIDLETEGMQYIEPGTIIYRGDIIATTNVQMTIPQTVLNFGIFNNCANKKANFGYWWDQELAYIGLDGQVNLMRPETITD